ncbi:S-layer homology domain-containing protein [Cohnella fermenti]|uniref:S-layer homology domain-containing protein n=2 Tax=Cohnella fermenti TaxID=2565925 RepID=A0A4S4BM20_9BACL|nr:S-layer homology domain-containing protein [Cohnella fermenti]
MVLIDRALAAANRELPAGDPSDLAGFTDQAKVAEFARASIAALVKSGLVAGNGSEIRPQGQATRAETAVLIYRIYTLS